MSESRSMPDKPRPFVFPQLCKGCGRCIEACPRHCISLGEAIHPASGFVPVVLDLAECTACGLCLSACPEPYGLAAEPGGDYALDDPAALFGPRPAAPRPAVVPDQPLPLPETAPLVVKGTYASAIGALLAGCRHFFGYPITPSTEGAELMAKLLPQLDGVFLQAVSEVATVNMMYGAGGAGLRAMTFTSSPGFSLMLEGISYMIGAELPGVFVNVMRGGPGLGNIGPEQADIKLACRGLGHGNTHALVLAPSTPQEMLDLTMLAFDRSFAYRNPVVVLGDGYLGQMTGHVRLPRVLVRPGLPDWAVWGDAAHRGNLICSIFLSEADLEAHNVRLNEKYRRIAEAEQRADLFLAEDADVLLVACNTPARMAKGAVRELRARGIRAGLFRPITLWPFPIDALRGVLGRVRRIVVVEASPGQLEDELRLALSHAGVHAPPPITHVRRFGGVLPQQREIVEHIR
ncbi:MAG TPA: 3-methyl-2-oxobutanoate dehydrogenase subunit VorB [Candidatus Polarisedimenticolaceae bacterium]|nr:3-methyl-2-oxobutanoate dehydrogenase subunit VorB [Candidatus Polarisedimenticolaceae bacterium]